MKKSFYLVIAIFLLITGCKEKGTNPTNSKVLIPLTVGNKWVYNWYGIHTNGDTSLIGVDYHEVIKDSIDNGIHWGIIQDSSFLSDKSFDHSSRYAYTNKADGYYSGDHLKENQLVYKYPGIKGESYEIDSVKINIDDINFLLKVGIGTFNCYKYSCTPYENGKLITYIAPGIGKIQVEQFTNDTLVSKWELVNYTVK